ncbi:MAG: N-acetylmuramoyl-L-alanine amidase [Myxococcota bacterium]
MKRILGLFVVGFLIGGIAASALTAGVLALRIAHRHVPIVVPIPEAGPRPVPAAPTEPLSGLVVYLSAGHGQLLHRQNHDGEPISWGRQRSPKFGMLEDDWTAAFVADFLAPALERAGATVLTLRERDRNPVSLVVDDVSTGLREGFAAFGIASTHDDPLAEGGAATRLYPGGSASWRLTVPSDGQWYAYVRWSAEDDLDDQAIYTVSAGGAVREYVVDQRGHGGHWMPLGDDCLPAGTVVEVTLTGSGASPLSADAVRIGGGKAGVILPWAGVYRQMPYYEVSMAHQLDRLGGPPWIGTYECGAVVSDMRLRPHWASWAAESDAEAMYLSIHTNASPYGSPKGLTAFYGVDSTPPTPADPESVRLATLLDQHLHATVHATDKGYVDRGTRPGDYSEISPVHNTMPAALLEMGFHDNKEDAARMQSLQFRRNAADGITAGVVEWRQSRAPDAVDRHGSRTRTWATAE